MLEESLRPSLEIERIEKPVSLPPALRTSLQRGDATQRLRVTDTAGQEITEQTRARFDDAAVVLAAPRAEPFIVRLDHVEQVALPRDGQRIPLPGGMVLPGAAGEREMWLQLTFGASPIPVVWDPDQRRYRTKLWFGLRASDHAPGDLASPEPVPVRINFVGLTAEEVAPLRLERPGLDHEQGLEFHFLPTTEKPTLQIRSSLTDVDLDLDVPPRVELRPVHRQIPGLGLGKTDVVVAHLLPHGPAIAVDQPLSVTLSIDGRATPESTRVEIPAGQSETRFLLRSSGLGPVTVRVSAAGFSDSVRLHQYLPLAPPVAALLGGMLGGFARSFLPKARRRAAGRRVLEGLVVAMIVFVAAVLGVAAFGLPPAIAGTEAGAFLTGALAGFCGVILLEKLTRSRFWNRPAA
ncbi:MAG: hypothetical protein EA425_01705 [Puniceicoccaceae bacterium]|nr:MAG: hypothetical protein EA425_01705 [Puniceicoccaceae bacterium]